MVSLLLLTDNSIEGPGGSERFLRNLVQGLPSERYRIEVVQLSPPLPAGDRIALRAAEHVSCRHLPVGPVYGRAGLQAWWQLRSEVAEGRYAIVQSHHEKSDLIAALLPRGPAAALRISNRRDMGFQKSRRLRQAFTRLNGRFDRLVAPSAAILEGVRTHEAAPADRLVCIPNGVDSDRFAPLPPSEREAVRAQLGCGPEHLLIGCVASLSTVKRHVDLVNAFATVQASLPQARLVLIGDGPLREPVEQQLKALGLQRSVLLLGVRNDAHRLWPAMDLAVLASSTEGLSNALLEAQSCGLPVVATRVGGNPELVADESLGLLVPPLQPEALAQALVRAATQEGWRREAGKLARTRVLAHSSTATMVAAYDRLYQELLSGRRSAASPVMSGQPR